MIEPLYTADEMKAAETGHDVEELMERAGAAVAKEVLARFPDARTFTLYAGKGANGGDGKIAARILTEHGWSESEHGDIVIDALFGTGFRGPPREEAAALIERMQGRVVSVDIPSGVDASTGEVPGAAVRAEVTVTFHGPKVGLAVAPGRFHAGEVVVADIGLAPQETDHARVTPDILQLVPRKTERDNKYSAGSVLVVGGAPGMTGALCLAAQAAFRADAGYVAVAVPAESLSIVETKLLEPVKGTWDEVDRLMEKADVVAIGPGLGKTAEARAVAERITQFDGPVVVDADAIGNFDWWAHRHWTVLTPHSGELARLVSDIDVDSHRLKAVTELADHGDATVLLKGADTIVASPGEVVLVSDLGTPALATAGTGDVLTGVIAAYLAKGLEPRLAAAAGAAATQLASRRLGPGAVAGDLLEMLPGVLAR